MEWTALGQRIKERLASDVVPLAVLLAVVVCALTVWWIRRPETERMGTLCVETAPLAAEVTLDGTFCGLSPLAIPDVTYGERVLRIEKSGFKPSSQAVNIERKETSIQVTLQAEKLTIDLSVASDPPGALVRLAGETVGWTPARVEGLAPGSYDLVIRKEGYKPHQQSITLGAGLPASVKVTLQSKTEEVLEARVEETGASVRACVELAHHYILANDFERAAPPLAKALEMISGTGQKNRWVMEEIEKPYWEHYSYGDKEAVEACRCMLEDVLIAELKARPSHKIARDLLVDLLRKAGRWDRLAEAMSAGVVSVKDASP
ncbi:MAG: PEGA domain-containing protein, partial [Lentisphaeria bacterium]|nr:PEGA domain-containing protein [Lentisphaeria bacterium]